MFDPFGGHIFGEYQDFPQYLAQQIRICSDSDREPCQPRYEAGGEKETSRTGPASVSSVPRLLATFYLASLNVASNGSWSLAVVLIKVLGKSTLTWTTSNFADGSSDDVTKK